MKNTLMLMLSFLLIGTVVSCKKKGCTDQTANNFDTEAKKDNGTCTYDEVEEEEFGLATVTTSAITNLTTMTATSGGSIVTNGTIYDKGLCWGTSANPTITDSTISEGNNADAFVTNMSNLTQNTTYYVRAYAENYYGVAYGNEQTFTTETIVLPTVTTNTITLVTSSRVNVTATVTSDGGGIISEKGICWATTTNPTPADMHLTYGGDVTDFDLDLWNLESDQTYYIRAYITNEAGTSYGNELEYVQQSINSAHISGDGTFTKKCNAFLEDELGVKKALLVTSCTNALEMSAILLDIKPGDEMIIPSFTFVSTVNAFVLRGAKPVFIDIRRDTMNMDENQLEGLITEKTKAIIPVHYAGVGCEMDIIMNIANKYDIPVIEDNAHGLFGKYKDRYLGTFGTFATQSFHETKNFSCGEGGALLINGKMNWTRSSISTSRYSPETWLSQWHQAIPLPRKTC